ncbi:FAD-dependent oxidoreductase [Nevskia ramosa]|uniref:FAD-dependent oxidoreductase n=1 Tax=Nevskia ramosa TaxID=64002 RepID=UPI003D101502
MTDTRAMRIAIIGSGPAGMYAAAHLLGTPTGTWLDGRMVHLTHRRVEVDVIEQLPTPWGLVRGGVAPDHPEKKQIVDVFERVASREEFRFFGNLEVGRDLSVKELLSWYDGVIFAHGAQGDRRMGIPGEDLANVASAREFVSWYNGSPDSSALKFDLSHERVVVIGNGNVALDVARLLTRDPAHLAKTDIATHALEKLRASKVREVVIVGRRGPLEAAFNLPELEELAEIEGVDIVVDAKELPKLEGEGGSADIVSRRKLERLHEMAAIAPSPGNRRILLRFLASPVEVLGTGRVESLRFTKNRLVADVQGQMHAHATSADFEIDAGLVLRAVGYAGIPVQGLPFDALRRITPNSEGRVVQTDGTAAVGLYVAGWAKRGPSGIIGTNRLCARDTVRTLLADADRGLIGRSQLPGREDLARHLVGKKAHSISFADWETIDRREKRAGRAAGRPREKFTTVPALLEAARPEHVSGITAAPKARRLDAIVVGSGLGGLSTAACLAASGKSVMVLEAHEIVGGCAQTFRRKGIWEFDCGVHYVGGCVPGGDGMIATVFRGLGIEDRIAWSRLDDSGMDTVQFPEHQFRVPTSWAGLTANLCQCFPKDADGLAKAVAELQCIGEGFDRINDVPHSIGVLLPLLKHPVEAFKIARGLELPISRLFDRYKLSFHARAALLSLVHLHNTAPSRTPALLVAMLLRCFFKEGAFFPTMGGQVLPANLVEVIRSHGGVVRTKARVRSIDVEGGRVQGVTLTDGERIRADVVVSNADIHRTFQDLIEPRHLSRRTLDRIARLRRPHSIYSMYLGADIDLSRTRPATNFILHDRYDMQTTFDLLDKGQWDPKGWLAISSPTLKTGGVRHYGPPGYSSIEAFCAVPGEYEFWGGGDPMAGTGYKWSPVYRERKAEIEQVMLDRILRALPELRGHVAWQESASPLTHERFTLSRMPYGPENTADQLGPFRRPSVRTEIDGLFLAGASTAFLYSIAFTLRGGVGAASEILGRDLFAEFHKGKVIVDRHALPAHGADWDPFQACRGHSRRPDPVDEKDAVAA